MISTHSAHEDGDGKDWYSDSLATFISTHSAHEDGDVLVKVNIIIRNNFNPLRPRGRRRFYKPSLAGKWQFQPTPPTRTETGFIVVYVFCNYISTHSAHEDGDHEIGLQRTRMDEFQPTPPTRTET